MVPVNDPQYVFADEEKEEEFHLDLEGKGEEFDSGHCWLPLDIEEVIKQIRDAEVTDGEGVKVTVSKPSTNHNILTRSEMEKDIKDINIQIILYPNNSYELSQSLSIFEALRYNKPIIHINNPCINFYNNSKNPIGLKCQTLEDMANTIKKLVENKNYTSNLLTIFEKSLMSVRKQYSIDSSIARLKFIYENINKK